ncbi:MAG: sigma-70 family RNA polymerase sigma factor [Fibrobacteres bacterium]|nr:sigma-70 family RNA polymerase sigma factor [Fibrobacterota bacterium]
MVVVVEEIGVKVQVRVAEMPRDLASEVNSPAFLKALRNGPPVADRAFRDLTVHLRFPLIRFIGRWLRDTEAIEDVMQETFLAVHRSLPRFEGKSRLTTWVYSLAHHKVMDRLSEKYKPGYGVEQAPEHSLDIEAVDPWPDEHAHQTLLIKQVRAAAQGIPDLYREAWHLRDVEGMTGEEAAEALGITPTLVRVRLHRARNMIVARLRRDRPGLFTEAK